MSLVVDPAAAGIAVDIAKRSAAEARRDLLRTGHPGRVSRSVDPIAFRTRKPLPGYIAPSFH